MLQEAQLFFIDVLGLIPFEKSVIYINSPHEEVLSLLEKMRPKLKEFSGIKLNRENREFLLFEIIYNDIEEYIHSLEIKINDAKVFEGYDGMEYGMFSKNFELQEDFRIKYTGLDMCMISNEW